jgi:hypothetical protein
MDAPTHIAAYYFPNYHVDPRNAARYGGDWTEWKLAKEALPRYPGHQQPKVPLWGYEDEADTTVMARKIDAAANHGVSSFIFDWYYYNDGPFLQRALEEGFLGAPNSERLKFSLMWANHDWIELFPAIAGKKMEEVELLYPGTITPATWDKMTNYILEKYFSKPNYWKVEGKPYFSIYDLTRLIEGFDNSIAKTRLALDTFRAKAQAAGFPGLHLNAVVRGAKFLPGETKVTNSPEVLAELGFDSATTYAWLHHTNLGQFPETSYASVRDRSTALWPEFERQYSMPYYPNVSMGWDSSPRTQQDVEYIRGSYPYLAVMAKNSPSEFAKALVSAKEFLAPRPESQRILIINAWNEWTEGSYLEPDTINGMSYLEALRNVFPSAKPQVLEEISNRGR